MPAHDVLRAEDEIEHLMLGIFVVQLVSSRKLRVVKGRKTKESAYKDELKSNVNIELCRLLSLINCTIVLCTTPFCNA